MLNNFGRFFERSDEAEPDFTRKESLNLFGDERLEAMLGRLQEAPPAEQYPLQVVFYEKLMACDLLLPVPEGTNLSQGLPIIALENGDQEKGMPLFTSEATLSLWLEEEADYVALSFSALCGYAMEANLDYIVVNVAGPYGCEISFHDFSYLAEGLLPPPRNEQGRSTGEVVVEKNTPMRLSAGQGLSGGVMERLLYLFQTNQEMINKVYQFDVAFNDGPMQPAIAVRVPDGCEERWEMELWPTVQAVLHEMLERREIVNVFLLNHAGSMERHVEQVVEPIFRS
jgi:hypothetical protein